MGDNDKVGEIMNVIFDELGVGIKIKTAVRMFLSTPKAKSKIPAIYNKIVNIVNE